ncbi:hypothetical protein [Sphingomonas sp. 3-13AW]|uniref:hypothetical protein n=1 Tax=Sphingomonas sp. 3-13AW TaxID=3050450 RepID=UPI003BB5598C
MQRPEEGDLIEMRFMGADVEIRVQKVCDDQPRANEGIFSIEDQYGERHEVEFDGSWATTVHAL